MKASRLLAAALSGAVIWGAGTVAAHAQGADPRYYLSVGDSYAVGYQPNGNLTHGFAQQLLPKARKRGHDLTLVNLACGGATTTSILNRKGCSKDRRAVGTKSYAPLTQTQAAARFLRNHRGDVELVTISIGGNDITACGRGVPDPIQCVAQTVTGINTTIVNPGFFRTGLLTADSANYASASIPDYAERHAERVQWYENMNGQQEGDPVKLARALLTIADRQPPPRRFIALAAILEVAEQKAKLLQHQAEADRDLSASLAYEGS